MIEGIKAFLLAQENMGLSDRMQKTQGKNRKGEQGNLQIHK